MHLQACCHGDEENQYRCRPSVPPRDMLRSQHPFRTWGIRCSWQGRVHPTLPLGPWQFTRGHRTQWPWPEREQPLARPLMREDRSLPRPMPPLSPPRCSVDPKPLQRLGAPNAQTSQICAGTADDPPADLVQPHGTQPPSHPPPMALLPPSSQGIPISRPSETACTSGFLNLWS